MRTLVVAHLSAVAAALIALGVGAGSGWFDGSDRTVVVPEAASSAGGRASPVRAAKPVVGNGFDPAALYARRSPGVVTLYAEFGSSEAQGSGFVVTRSKPYVDGSGPSALGFDVYTPVTVFNAPAATVTV